MPTTPTYEDWGFVFQSPMISYKPELIAWCKTNWGEPFGQWLMGTGGDCASLGVPVVFFFRTQEQLTQFVLAWCT